MQRVLRERECVCVFVRTHTSALARLRASVLIDVMHEREGRRQKRERQSKSLYVHICLLSVCMRAYYYLCNFACVTAVPYLASCFLQPMQANAPPVFGSISAEDKCFSAPDILPTSNGRHLYNGCRSDSLTHSYHSDHGFHQSAIIGRPAGTVSKGEGFGCGMVSLL